MEKVPFSIEPATEFRGTSDMEQAQRRRTGRFPFSATAEIVHAGNIILTHVTDLCLFGCYLDVGRPLPRGTRVSVKIIGGGQFFEAAATVAYSQPNIGMGLAFREVKPQFLGVLHNWLRQSLDAQKRPPL